MNGLIPAMASRPEIDEIEITLFGSGYGESIVIHTGGNDWIIVDSTTFHDKNEPVALKYLTSIGVDVASQVKAVIATHWHDDHIRGISTIAEKCLSATFYISEAPMAASNSDKFKNLLIDSPIRRRAELMVNSNSGLNEFIKLFEILKKRKTPPKYAGQDKLLLEKLPFQLWALAPHSSIYEQAIEAIIAKIHDGKSVGRSRAPKPNHTSVVLWLKFADNVRVLLGADLEENSEHKGWSLIASEKKDSIIDYKAEFFKVAHHGSITGHHERIWQELLTDNPLCLVAPFSRNPKLPTNNDILRINKYSNKAYLTHYIDDEINYKMIEEKEVRKKSSKRKLFYAYELGSHIKTRKKIGEDWTIEKYGNASHLSSFLDNKIIRCICYIIPEIWSN